MSRSKLAKDLGVEELPCCLMDQYAARMMAGVSSRFFKDQVTSGEIPAVFLVPGLVI
jgi:hypothetical protein